MADEPTTPAPYDADALATRMRGVVREELNHLAGAAQQRQAQQAQQVQQQQAVQAASGDPIYQAVVKPYLEPALRAMNVQTQAAVDAVHFYNRHPEAREYQPHIEQRFGQMVQAGTPFDRETVWDHFRGQNLTHFIERQQQAVQQAGAQGATIGAPGVGRTTPQPFNREEFRALPLEQMEQRLAGVTF